MSIFIGTQVGQIKVHPVPGLPLGRENHNISIDLQRMPLDDLATFELLADGETGGIFQLEGTGMRRYITELKPTTFNDIAAMVALYRPGPMEHIPTIMKNSKILTLNQDSGNLNSKWKIIVVNQIHLKQRLI